jgi:hypothetical protein
MPGTDSAQVAPIWCEMTGVCFADKGDKSLRNGLDRETPG